MKRRQLVRSLAIGSAVPLAGCLGSDGTDGDGRSPTAETGGDVEETRVTPNDVRLTVTDALTTASLAGSEQFDRPEDGKRFLLVNLQVRNNADEVREIPGHGDLSVRTADGIRQNQVTTDDSGLVEPVSETYAPDRSFTSIELEPGEQSRGWLGYAVPDAETEFKVELPDLLTKDDETVAWDLILPAETGVAFEETVEFPESPPADSPTQVAVTVANAGNRTGRLDRTYAVHLPFGDSATGSMEGGLAAGEETTTAVEFTPPMTGPYSLSGPRGESDAFSAVAPEFAFGEPWALSTGLEITVYEPTFAESITYDNDDDAGLEATPDDGTKFLVFDFDAEADDESYWNPMFVAASGGTEVTTQEEPTVYDIFEGYDEVMTSPLSGEITNIDNISAEWPDYSGPMVVQVPESFSMSDLTLRLQDEDTDDSHRYAAEWTTA